MGSWTFAYDHLNRLLSGTPTSGVYSGRGQRLCLAYDSFGNRTQSDLQAAACGPSDAPTAKYSAANQVTFTTANGAANGFAYDAAGDVTYDGSNYYAYDAEGRVCATQTAPYSGGVVAYGYLYDAEGRRVAKGSITPAPLGQFPSCNPATNGFTLTESYVLGQGGERLTTTSWFPAPGIALVAKAANAVPVPIVTLTGAWQSTSVYAGAKLIAAYDAATSGAAADAGSAGGLHFQLTDPLGTRRVQTNSAGEAELDCQSLPFGDQLSCFPDPNAPGGDQDEDATGMLTGIHFTGKERDAESGLDYFGARYYGSNMGRWMSPDWSTVISPVPYAQLADPQSLNLYAYVRNNPLSHTDPDGHECTVDGEKHGGLWCFGHVLGLVETKVEQTRDARFYENQYWSERGVAPKDRPQLNNDQVLNAYKSGAFAKPDNDIEKMEAGIVGGVSMYRGGSSLLARAMDVKIDPETGLLKTTRGISLSTDPDGLARFGGAHEIESIPEGLEIKQVGQNANHYELTPKQPMSMEQYQNLLNQVKFK